MGNNGDRTKGRKKDKESISASNALKDAMWTKGRGYNGIFRDILSACSVVMDRTKGVDSLVGCYADSWYPLSTEH